jgi:hypothetical protein
VKVLDKTNLTITPIALSPLDKYQPSTHPNGLRKDASTFHGQRRGCFLRRWIFPKKILYIWSSSVCTFTSILTYKLPSLYVVVHRFIQPNSPHLHPTSSLASVLSWGCLTFYTSIPTYTMLDRPNLIGFKTISSQAHIWWCSEELRWSFDCMLGPLTALNFVFSGAIVSYSYTSFFFFPWLNWKRKE